MYVYIYIYIDTYLLEQLLARQLFLTGEESFLGRVTGLLALDSGCKRLISCTVHVDLGNSLYLVEHPASWLHSRVFLKIG